MVRPNTVNFLQEMKQYFNIFIVTWIQKELVIKLLPYIDPDGTVFPVRKQIQVVKHSELKSVEVVI